jgi:CBS domain-containing protein
MLVRDAMTKTVTTVHPDTPLPQAIAHMIDLHVSGLPVVTETGALCGVLTEGDLLRRVEVETETTRPGWLDLLLGPARLARDYVQSHSKTVGDVMTPDVISITEDATLKDAVKLMEKKHIKRLPVIRGDALIGLLSRSDIVRVLGQALAASADAAAPLSDADIAHKLREELAHVRWANAHNVSVTVKDGVVTLEGVIFTETVRPALRVAAQSIPGVRAVEDHVFWLEPLTGTTMIS